jgi:UDP-N-acetylglucosamine 4,6-dehydratase
MSSITNKTILVTGGTGSFGHRFVERALAYHDPKRIIVFSRDELKQHEMQLAYSDPRLTFFLGDVRDRDRLIRAFQARVDLVIHAAALKQVPACEYNPFEAIKTNVLGAQNVIDAAIECSVPRVLALSTDKAVNPINLYGATKLCAEKLFVQGNSYAGSRPTRFSCVRYGNVMGSRGSVIPLFREQQKFGRVTVTDQRMTRFWITLDQGVEFVIQCVERMQGGEVFVPRIPSMGIMDLTTAIAPNCEVDVTGIRPGEKLHETLISVDEARHSVVLDDMFVIVPEFHPWGKPDWSTGRPLPDDFAYASNLNESWLTVESLREVVEDM